MKNIKDIPIKKIRYLGESGRYLTDKKEYLAYDTGYKDEYKIIDDTGSGHHLSQWYIDKHFEIVETYNGMDSITHDDKKVFAIISFENITCGRMYDVLSYHDNMRAIEIQNDNGDSQIYSIKAFNTLQK